MKKVEQSTKEAVMKEVPLETECLTNAIDRLLDTIGDMANALTPVMKEQTAAPPTEVAREEPQTTLAKVIYIETDRIHNATDTIQNFLSRLQL